MISIGIIIDDISKSAGTERAVSSLVNGLREFYSDEYKITILSLFSSGKEEVFFDIDPAVEIIHLNKSNDFNALTKFFWYRKLVGELKKINAEKNFQILMGTTYVHNILLGFVTKNTATRSIGCEHEVYGYPPAAIQQIRKWAYGKLNALVVLNETEKAQYDFAKNTVIIPNSIPFISSRTSALNSKRIIAVGRLTHQKGFDMLIDAAQKVHVRQPEWEFHIFGTGEEEKMLSEKISERGLENVVFLRGITRDIISEYLESSLFVLSSRWESFGLVVIEAMNIGLPIVSFACDGPKNILKENGFLIPKFDVDQMAEKILELIENKDLRKEMGEKSITLTEKYKPENVMSLWNQMLQSVI